MHTHVTDPTQDALLPEHYNELAEDFTLMRERAEAAENALADLKFAHQIQIGEIKTAFREIERWAARFRTDRRV